MTDTKTEIKAKSSENFIVLYAKLLSLVPPYDLRHGVFHKYLNNSLDLIIFDETKSYPANVMEDSFMMLLEQSNDITASKSFGALSQELRNELICNVKYSNGLFKCYLKSLAHDHGYLLMIINVYKEVTHLMAFCIKFVTLLTMYIHHISNGKKKN